jgi:UDP:flavonoid glycosyltransferase YjiC (YdhE family)
MAKRILLSTFGTHGDLFPVLALAEALEAEGQPTRLLLTEDDAAHARARGLETVALGPPQEAVLGELGLSRDALVAQVFKDPTPLVRDVILPRMAALTRASLPHAADARAVAGTLFAFGAPLLAEKTALPFVPLLLQPMMCGSALLPARVPGLSPPMRAAPRSALGRSWNRAWLRLVKASLRRKHLPGLNKVRAELGLPPTKITPLLEFMGSGPLRLGLWDAAFAQAPPDAPTDLQIVGFPNPRPPAALPPDLASFLADGLPPLCVTLGSMAQSLGGPNFYANAVALARALGLRTVLLHGMSPAPTAVDVFAIPQADHAALLPHCAMVLHHGGIGTTAATLFAARPHLIFPLGADQPDTAAHIERLGLGRRLPNRLTSAQAVKTARAALACAPQAKAFAPRLSCSGSQNAARTLLSALAQDTSLQDPRFFVPQILICAGRAADCDARSATSNNQIKA